FQAVCRPGVYFMIKLLFLMIVLNANLIQFVLSLSVLYFSSTFLFILIAASVPLISLMSRIISPLLFCLTSCVVYVLYFFLLICYTYIIILWHIFVNGFAEVY